MNSIPENVNSTIDDELVVRLFHQRVVVLGDQLDQSLGSRLCSQLLLLSADDSHKDISFWINSPGGSPSAMLAVYDTMRFISCDVATTCVGQAVGAAAVLLAGGTAGQRGILRHGRVVLHQPAIEGKGTIPDLIIHADEVLRVRALASRIRSACLRSIRLQLDRTAAGGANFCATPRRESRMTVLCGLVRSRTGIAATRLPAQRCRSGCVVVPSASTAGMRRALHATAGPPTRGRPRQRA